MINLYLTKNVNNEELESLETSYFSRNLANVIVNSLVSASDISLLYSRHLIYLEIEDKDILDENIPMILEIGTSNNIYVEERFNSEMLMNILIDSVNLNEINIFNGNIYDEFSSNINEPIDKEFLDISGSTIIEDLFPTGKDKIYSFMLMGESYDILLKRSEFGIITNLDEDNPIMKSDSLKRLILNLMLKSKGLDDED